MSEKKIAIIAGINFNIGGNILTRLLQEDFIVIVPVKSADEIIWLKAISVLAGKGSLVTFIADYADYYRAVEIFKDVHEKYGIISLCIFFIEPMQIDSPLAKTTITNWEKMVEFNITGYFVIVRLMFGYMAAYKQGSLITISKNIEAVNQSHFKLDQLSEIIQNKMAEMFFQEIKGSGIIYNHVFIKENINKKPGKYKKNTAEMSNFVFGLYKDAAKNKGILFQWI